VVGNVNGEIKKLYALAESIQKQKGAFDALFCAGKFFPPTVPVSINAVNFSRSLQNSRRKF
jgi:hypothetical protein